MHASRIRGGQSRCAAAGHYDRVLRGGRVQRHAEHDGPPDAAATRRRWMATTRIGHHAAYVAMDQAIELARESGIGAVGVILPRYFGAAGRLCRVPRGGMIACHHQIQTGSWRRFRVREAFHAPNPLAFAAPSGGARLAARHGNLVYPAEPAAPLQVPRSVFAGGGRGRTRRAADRGASDGGRFCRSAGVGFSFKGAALAASRRCCRPSAGQ